MTDVPPSPVPPGLRPTTAQERRVWLRLLRSRRVGPATFWRLLAEHGTAEAALEALPAVARQAGVDDYAVCPEAVIAAEGRAGAAVEARLVALPDPDYPVALRDLAEPPPLLWIRGRADLLSRPTVALVGARNASSLGTRMAARLAADLSEAGFVVVSGLARGIDAVAHDRSVERGTIAVMAGGVDVIYPAENTALASRIATQGALLSDQPMGLAPQARHFPARNRLIAGLSRAVVVVEAAAKSGSLITARMALDIGREVLAVPGHPFDARASGCNMLIRDGAELVRSAADIIEVIGAASPSPPRQPALPLADVAGTPRPPHPRLREIAALHRRILDRLGPSPMAEDQLVRDLATDARSVAPALTDLELEGRISRQPGGLIARVN